MFQPISGGSEVVIQGIKCYLPPVGVTYNFITGKYEKTGVYARSTKKSECYWEVDPRFKQYRQWEVDEAEKKKKDSSYVHAELEAFKKDMWMARMGGMWFSNNGVPTYITGQYFFYLSCHYMPNGNPDYRDVDRQFFYVWQHVQENPDCYGLNIITRRRYGKTHISGSIALELSTRSNQFNVGIQSKTDPDAKEVYLKAIISPFKRLPSFFQPVSNLPKGKTLPASGLRFNSGKMEYSENELESIISFKASNVFAYDGWMLGFYVGDEVGKTENVNIYDRYNVIKYCLVDHNGRLVGKALHTTTVEDMKNGDRSFHKLWKNSKEIVDGKTISGLYNFFIPAYMGMKPDKYGIDDEEANKKEILAARERMRNVPKDLASEIRKRPFDEREAFLIDAEECRFNPMLINERIDALTWIEPQYEVGNFHWVDGVRFSKVVFVPNPNGRWMVKHHPPENQRNLVNCVNGYYVPINTQNYGAGTDPYDHRELSKQSERKMSFASNTIIKAEDPLNPTDMDWGIAAFYLFRPDSPEIAYEDSLMAYWYYGCFALIEINKPGLKKYLQDNYCSAFMPFIDNKQGISASATSNNFIAEITDQYINSHINKVWFLQLLYQWLSFKPEDTTEFDGAMSFGYALMLLKNSTAKTTRRTETKDIGDTFRFMRRKSFEANGR